MLTFDHGEHLYFVELYIAILKRTATLLLKQNPIVCVSK